MGWVWTEYEDRPAIDDYPLNLIAEPFGIFFSQAAITDVGGVCYEQEPIAFHRPFFATHPITENVEKIGASDSIPGSLVVEEPALPVVWGNNETSDSDGFKNPVMLAVNENAGAGRVVCLQHSHYVEQFEFDNFILLQNILNWLSRNDENEAGVPGRSQSINVLPEPDQPDNDLDMKTVLELGRMIDQYFIFFPDGADLISRSQIPAEDSVAIKQAITTARYNRTFGPIPLKVYCLDEITNYEFYVFNRCGQLVFESKSVTDEWDGEHKDE